MWGIFEIKNFDLGDGASCVAFSPDGARIVSGMKDGSVKIWHVQLGVELVTLPAGRGAVQSVSFSRDGAVIAVVVDGVLNLWDSVAYSVRRAQGGSR